MKSLPRNGLPMCAALVAIAALGQQSADAGQASWPDGASVWHLSDLTEATGKHHPLRLEGDGVQVGVPLAALNGVTRSPEAGMGASQHLMA